jgi:hypothetical protein
MVRERSHLHCACPLRQLIIYLRKFYDLLDVAEDASEADLKKAYRKK